MFSSSILELQNKTMHELSEYIWVQLNPQEVRLPNQ